MDAAATRSSSRKPWVARGARTSGRANPAGDGNVGILSAPAREARPALMSPNARAPVPAALARETTALRARPSRVPRGEAAPRPDRDDRARATPRARHFARDEDGTGPHARCPELGASGRIAHEQLAVGSLEEEVGVAARQEPRRCRPAIDRRAERLLVLGQDPPLAGGVCTGVSDPASASNTAGPRGGLMPAHSANDSAVIGPKTWRYRRASSSRASTGSTSGRGTVQIVGCRAPSQRISTRPVGAA